MPTWPASLPQDFLVNDFGEQFPDGAIRQDMDSGPAYQRQRYTAAPERIQGSIWVDKTQYNTLKNFWTGTVAHGALAFDWKHPITDNAASVQFDVSDPPSVSAFSGLDFQVSFTIEVLP